MRKIVNLTKPKDGIVRLMIYNDNYGTYLFGFKKLEDCSSEFDYWFESENNALESCKSDYGIKKTEWNKIPNPILNCQHDWINPVRIKGREKGINGKWIELNPTE